MALPPETLEAIARFDTCAIANAIEHFGVRLRNEGYTRPGLRCLTGGFPSIIGYAATCRVHSADPPVRGGAYVESTAWWTGIEKLPVPRIAVIQAAGEDTGASIVGEVHAAILKAFHCAGVITNGGVRDLPAVMRMGFPMFARNISVSHAYAHLVDMGHPVEIFGLKVHSGDLIYADCHGAISIPLAIASKIPEAAAQIRDRERRIIDVCQSPGFSPERLLQVIRSNS
jgi:4-hydroxy-4-methyl-2-oxoglutarate aldolase